jgi:hypothetical protein
MITVATTVFIVGADPMDWSIDNFSDEYLKHFIACEEPCYEPTSLNFRQSQVSHTHSSYQ